MVQFINNQGLTMKSSKFNVQVLSRAFRNRFFELHFDDIPSKEVEVILQRKCLLPPSYSKKMVAVMKELQVCAMTF